MIIIMIIILIIVMLMIIMHIEGIDLPLCRSSKVSSASYSWATNYKVSCFLHSVDSVCNMMMIPADAFWIQFTDDAPNKCTK